MTTIYLTIIEIAAIHQDLISRYGGTHGIRDRGALESACLRPQSGYYNSCITNGELDNKPPLFRWK